ncbi:hypothetical protein NC99_43970 [Sunxiuqinia dokdonensis]|uniref:RNA polymerase sigma-70 factor n=1 Tax=Sunxiuqinia dokdonensis TaxID=1409788 RepID=A0A0L8V347_9BACT|nr:hypothetical protein NC99_43970 [Sunxiuqinia dokdonensis]
MILSLYFAHLNRIVFQVGLLAEKILFEQYFKDYHFMLVAYAQKFVHDEEVAYDLVQDAFLNLWRNFSSLSNPKAAKSYLFTSVRNNCLNHLSKKSVRNKYSEESLRQKIEEINDYQTAYSSLLEKEIEEKLRKAVASLPEKYQQPFRLSRFENQSTKEIAEQLDLPVRTVETRIYRALKQIKIELQDYLLLFFVHRRANKFPSK